MLSLYISAGIASIFLVIIHFFGLRIRQKLEFSHIQFLSSLVSKTKSVKNIQNILLLIFRGVFIGTALLSFVLFLKNAFNAPIKSNANPKEIIDSSWSMVRPLGKNEGSIIDKAIKDANTFSPEKAIDEQIKQANHAGDVHENVSFSSGQQYIEALKASQNISNQLFFSDFSKSSFPEDILDSFPKNQQISLIPYTTNQPNFFIDSVWLEQPLVVPNQSVGFYVQVRGSQQSTSELIEVTAYNGANLVGTVKVMVEPSKTAKARFVVKPSKDSELVITVQVEDYSTTFDNKHFIVIPKANEVNVGSLGTLPSSHPVIRALEEEPAFSFSSSNLSKVTFLVVDMHYAGSGISLTNRINEVVNRGGSVIIIPNQHNQKPVLSVFSSLGLQGITEESSEVPPKTLKAPDYADSFFKGIFEKQVKNMNMPQMSPVLTWRSAFHTILRFTDNSPFVSSFKKGKGNIYLFASPLQLNSPFTTHPLFVPTIYQLALQGQSSNEPLYYRPIKSEIFLPFNVEEQTSVPLSFTKDNRSFLPEQRSLQGKLQVALPPKLNEPGIYQLKNGSKNLRKIALNIPKEESLLESHSAEELKDFFADTHPNIKVVDPNRRESLQKQMQKEEGTSMLWKYCLILCLLCLLVEAIILSARRREIPV